MITKYPYPNDDNKSISRNVQDVYKEWSNAEIRADLDTRRSEMISVFQHLGHDFNVACCIRSNNAFIGKAVYIDERRRYDTRGPGGTRKYEHVYHAENFEEVINKLHQDGYIVYAVDNIEEYHPKDIREVVFPKKSAFVFGNEGLGLSEDAIKMSDDMIFVRQRGSVRSMNVAACASVVMYEYTRQHMED